MGIITSNKDVLIDIIRRLSLQEQFVSIPVSQQFHLAAIQALKQHDVLVVDKEHYRWPGIGRKDLFQESNIKDCDCGQHKLKKKDLIDSMFLENPTTRGKILAYLPGIQVVQVNEYIEGIHKDLSEYCPNISCLVIEYSDELALQPAVTHFTGCLKAALICKLPQVFPKLTSLCLRGDGLYEGHFNENSFREGITTLKLSSMFNQWPTVFKSPAINTVKKLEMYVSGSDKYGDREFVAPNLTTIDWNDDGYQNYEKQLTFILKSLCSSPFLEKLILQSSGMSRYQKVSVSLFTSFNRLKVIKLPRLVDINKILVTVCQSNPLLEDVLVYGINGEDGYVALQELSRLGNLKSLEIMNKGGEDKGISQEQLLEFLAQNQNEGQLRFLFTLHQSKHFPGNRNRRTEELDWNGIKWKFENYFMPR